MEVHQANNPEQLYDKLHEMSMDKNSPTRAANGRACKVFLNALETWLDDERARRTTLDNMVTAALSAQLTVLVGVLQFIPVQHREEEASRVLLTLMQGLLNGVKMSVEVETEANKKAAAS